MVVDEKTSACTVGACSIPCGANGGGKYGGWNSAVVTGVRGAGGGKGGAMRS